MKSVTPNIGKRAKGRSAVTATGTASVAHQIAMSTVTAATAQPISERDSGLGNTEMVKNAARPIQKPLFL